jgi:hypothetical protein
LASPASATACTAAIACLFAGFAGSAGIASADSSVETLPDRPPRQTAPRVGGPSGFAPTWDLDGLYLWLGPVGAAGRLEATWDSTFGADLTVIRIAERAPVAALGGTLGAGLWTERGGGRIWLDGVIGTRLGSRIYGVTAGPLVELSDLAHPRFGGSVGIWGFFGVTPYARFGFVEELGEFAEVGVHVALPVVRR